MTNRFEMNGFVGSARCDEAWRQRIGIENRCQMASMEAVPKRRGMVLPEIGPPLPTGATIRMRDSDLHPLRTASQVVRDYPTGGAREPSLRGSFASGRRALRGQLGENDSYRGDGASRLSFATSNDSRLTHRLQHLEHTFNEERESREAVREELQEIKSLMASLLKSRGMSDHGLTLSSRPSDRCRLPDVASSSQR